MDVIDLANEIRKCNLSESRRALIRLKKLANDIVKDHNAFKVEISTKIEEKEVVEPEIPIEKPIIKSKPTTTKPSTIGEKPMKKVVKPVSSQAKR